MKTPKRLFVLSFVISSVATSSAWANQFCESSSGINQLRDFVTCQSNPGIAACSGLAAGSTTYAAKKLAQKRMGKIQTGAGMDFNKLENELADSLHDEWRTGRKSTGADAIKKASELYDQKVIEAQSAGYARSIKGYDPTVDEVKIKRAVEERNLYYKALESARKTGVYFEPRIKEVNGKLFDIANLSYKDLPDQFKTENKESARVTVNSIKKHLAAGGSLDDSFVEKASSELHDEWLKRNGSWATAEQKLPFQKLSKVEADKDRVIIKKGLALIEKGSAPTTANRKAFNAAIKTSAKMGPKAVLVAGGVAGVAAFTALEVATSSTPTGCSSPNDHLINRDPNNNCEIVHEIDGNVLKFLDQPEDEQLKALKDPKVCDFYSKLNSKLMSPPKFTKLKCDRNGFQLVTKSNDGREINHKVSYYNGSKDIRNVTMSGGTERNGTYVVEVNGDGSIRNASTMAKVVVPLKLYISDAQECCTSGDDAAHDACLAKYNSGDHGSGNDTQSTGKAEGTAQ